TIKTPACPVVVAPPAAGVAGEWQIEADGVNVRAEFRNSAGELLGFALTGDATKAKIELQKALPAILP
ncbi:MAG: rubredoxin reductase, partial [Haliea sp.]